MSDRRQAALEYLAMRRSLGFSLEGEGRLLMNFIGYLEREGATQVTTERRAQRSRPPDMGNHPMAHPWRIHRTASRQP